MAKQMYTFSLLLLLHAGIPQQQAETLLVSAAALHPDWQLFLDALYSMLVQPNCPVEELLSTQDPLLCFSKLTIQLTPNIAAQQTAAAIICSLHLHRIEYSSEDDVNKFQLV